MFFQEKNYFDVFLQESLWRQSLRGFILVFKAFFAPLSVKLCSRQKKSFCFDFGWKSKIQAHIKLPRKDVKNFPYNLLKKKNQNIKKESVKRNEEIAVHYNSVEGKKLSMKATGLLSICIQHEVDHLEGVVFLDRLSGLKRNRAEKKFLKKLNR